jgi:hypothetical protein
VMMVEFGRRVDRRVAVCGLLEVASLASSLDAGALGGRYTRILDRVPVLDRPFNGGCISSWTWSLPPVGTLTVLTQGLCSTEK